MRCALGGAKWECWRAGSLSHPSGRIAARGRRDRCRRDDDSNSSSIGHGDDASKACSEEDREPEVRSNYDRVGGSKAAFQDPGDEGALGRTRAQEGAKVVVQWGGEVGLGHTRRQAKLRGQGLHGGAESPVPKSGGQKKQGRGDLNGLRDHEQRKRRQQHIGGA